MSFPSTFPGRCADDGLKGTIALDYTAVKNPAYANDDPSSRETAHIWELGGSSLALSDLVQVPITPQRLPTDVLVLVLDLSKPGDLCATALRWVNVVKKRVDDCMEKLRARKDKGAGGAEGGSATSAESLLQLAQARLRLGYAQRAGQRVAMGPDASAQQQQPEQSSDVGGGTKPASVSGSNEGSNSSNGDGASSTSSLSSSTPQSIINHIIASLPDHPDWRLISGGGASAAAQQQQQAGTNSSSLLPMQVIVVGSKWDELRDVDAVKRRAILAALRYIGLRLGAHLVVTSQKDKSTLQSFKSVFSHAAFGAEGRRGLSADFDGNKPLVIPAGADTLDSLLGLASSGEGAHQGNLRSSTAGSSSASPLGLRRSEVDSGTLQAGLDKFAALIRQWYPPSRVLDPGDELVTSANSNALSPGAAAGDAKDRDPTVFADDAAVLYPEPMIDTLRQAKGEELARYMREQKEKERRLVLEQRAAAQVAQSMAAGGAGTSAAAASASSRKGSSAARP